MPYRLQGGERTQIRYHVQMMPTVIDDTDHVSGLLPAPKDAAHEPEQMPDLAASLFQIPVTVAEPQPEPEPEQDKNVLFTYKSGRVKHQLRAGATLVKVGRQYYTELGRKVTAIYTDETCKRTVPEQYYSRLFNVSEDPTLFA